MKQALLTEQIDIGGEKKVRCKLCAHGCVIAEGKLGVCRVRKNIDGRLFSLNFDRVAAIHDDPIEKKPLYHFLPGSSSFSLAAMGCNFSCAFCQNSSLSVVSGEEQIYGRPISPEQLVAAARQSGCLSISYTYSEPTIYFELMLETAKLAHAEGISNVMVTNGYMSIEALEVIAPYLDAANVDLKAFTDIFYKQYCGAHLAPVLKTIREMRKRGIWVEVTTLMIPGLNDDAGELEQLIAFILEVDENMPWHVSLFYPQHRLTDIPPSSPSAIFRTLEIAKQKGLKYLYGGNVASRQWSDTHCPNCKALLIERNGYDTRLSGLDTMNGKCRSCGHAIAGVWKGKRV